jgi:hypothetical protein
MNLYSISAHIDPAEAAEIFRCRYPYAGAGFFKYHFVSSESPGIAARRLTIEP